MNYIWLLLPLLLSGCAMDGATAPMTHSKEETLSNNSVKGMYLFKIESNTNNITVNSRGDGKVSL